MADKVPKDVEDRIRRGRERLEQIAATRNMCFEYWRDNPYAWVDEKNILQQQATVTTVRGTGKKPWRARTKRNLLVDVVAHEVSASTQRVPSYEVVPSTVDPEDISAAKIAERVALFGYDKWNLRRATVEAVTHAVVGDESFAWAYFDNTVGPYIRTEDGLVGEGEVKVRVYSGNEVFWEPGVRFEESPWHAIEHARPLEQVRSDYDDKKLIADADTNRLSGQGQDRAKNTKMVVVTEYLERPTLEKPAGRWLCIANDRQLADKGRYPGEGDEPALRKLSYFVDPDNDRDMGLVRHLLSAVRTRIDCVNKLVEWKNLALIPQWVVTPGVMRKQRRTDEPGAIYEIASPEQNMKVVETPTVPEALFRILDQADSDIAKIASQGEPPSGVESGKAFATWFENNRQRRADFLANLADWHSRVMRDCLSLVASHYTENRLLQVRGRLGWEPVKDFKGAQLRNQLDVRVYPASIEPRTKTDVERKVMTFAQLGWVGPEVAMSAIQSGTAEKLVEDYDQDVAWARRRLNEIRQGPEVLFSKPMRVEGYEPITDPAGMPVIDPQTGQQMTRPIEVPGWMPRPFHNVRILKAVFESYMKSEEYEYLDPPMQQATDQVYDGLLQLEADKQAQAMEAQAANAAALGTKNAAEPQTGKPLPSFPGLPGMEPVGSEQNGAP